MGRGEGYTETEDEEIIRLHNEDWAWKEIGSELGRTGNSCRQRYVFLCKNMATPVPPKEVMDDFREASAKVSLREDEMMRPERPPVTTKATPPTTPREMWEAAEAKALLANRFTYERSRFAIKFDDVKADRNKPVALSFISDQHISPGNTIDFRRMRMDAELINETPGVYAALGGDGVDNHIKIRPASLAARSQPHEQYQMFDWYLSLFSRKILAIISGNHDAWTDQIAGIDMVGEIARRNGLCYCPAEAHIAASHEGQPYDITFRHQYKFNSQMNQGHAVKQLYRFGEQTFDIGCVCHHHEPHLESFEAHMKTRWVCRPGSYQIHSSYSRQYGFNQTRPTCPTFIMFPGERRIMGFHDLRDAVTTLAAERAKCKQERRSTSVGR